MQSVIDQIDEQTIANYLSYQQDSCGFMGEILDVRPDFIWPKMREVAESVEKNQFTVVPACHFVSKTFTAARLSMWFKCIFQPSTVITTAPSDNQVRNQLWREIHASYAGAKIPLGGNLTALMWDCKTKKAIFNQLPIEERPLWEKNFILGFSTSPDQATEHATKIQGFHNTYVLIILDEGCGILPQIWKAAIDSLIVNENCKVLAIGNPTDPLSEFYYACQPGSGWNVINISVFDTPNYKEGRDVIPGLAGRDYEKRIRERYGKDSNTYKIRVLGQFGDYKEGTYYGRELAQAEKDSRIGDYPADPAVQVYSFLDTGDIYTAEIDVQFIQGMIRIVDCYWDNAGLGIPEYKRALYAKSYNRHNKHYAGPDIIGSNEKSFQTGRTTRDIAAGLGIDLRPVYKHGFDDGIAAVRTIWPLLQINKPFCRVFINAIKAYRKRKNEKLSTEEQISYFDEPEKTNHACHFADALRHLAIAYRHQVLSPDIDGRILPDHIKTSSAKRIKEDYHPLNFGFKKHAQSK